MPATTTASLTLNNVNKQLRRPGVIHLPQPLPAFSPAPKQRLSTMLRQSPATSRQQQLRTPSPTPKRKQTGSNSSSTPSKRNHNQRRSSAGSIAVAPLSPPLTDVEPSSPVQPHQAKQDVLDASFELSEAVMLSPPPTPPAQHQTTRRTKKAKAAPPVLTKDQAALSLASPPPSPLAHKFAQAKELLGHAPPKTSSLLPAFDLKPSRSDDSLPLAEDDEVIIWKQPLSEVSGSSSFRSSPSASPVSTRTRSPSRSPSPSALIDWEAIKNLPRPDAATIAWLKEKYDIRPSTPSGFVKKRPIHPASCPSTPPLGVSATQPIPITRRPHGAHIRAPSVPTFPTSSRLALAQVKEDVAELFGLDIDDLRAVTKATEAWRAYSGSTFNVSSEMDRAPAPKFLGRLFN